METETFRKICREKYQNDSVNYAGKRGLVEHERLDLVVDVNL